MFIPYIGEKSKFSNFIIPKIPTDVSTYVEPFGGMFGIFFCLDMTKYKNTKFIYNDINKLNSNLFRKLKDPNFLDSLLGTSPTEELYYTIQKNIINNTWSSTTKAINWLILLFCSKSQYNIIDGVWKGDFEFQIFKLKMKYETVYLNKIESVSNKDYKDIIVKYDSKSTFFYIDPPYKSSEHFYINHNFTNESHIELSKVLRNIKGRFALSYYYFPEIDEWYKGYNIIKNKTLMGTELLIMNY
jgi:DNA adenine methylase